MRLRTMAVLGMAALALAACRSEKPAVAVADSAAAPAATALPTVTFTTTDYKFDGPMEIPAGHVTLRLVNQGPGIHHISLFHLRDGKTAEDFVAALKAGGPPPRWAVDAGGPNPREFGDTASTTLLLEPGNYAMVCFVPDADGVPHVAKGMVRPLTVTGAPAGAAAEPSTDLVMELVDYGFELSRPLPAGRSVLRVENAGPQVHEVVLVRLDAGKGPMDFASWGEKMTGPPPGKLSGGVSGIMPGAHAYVDLDLPPGEYGLICFVPDMKDGKGHYRHGMIKKITVAG
jgi:uncharacterized cupredoxin-like copper-binding protein